MEEKRMEVEGEREKREKREERERREEVHLLEKDMLKIVEERERMRG